MSRQRERERERGGDVYRGESSPMGPPAAEFPLQLAGRIGEGEGRGGGVRRIPLLPCGEPKPRDGSGCAWCACAWVSVHLSLSLLLWEMPTLGEEGTVDGRRSGDDGTGGVSN
jgi:hypothetical protein